mmetsp:Transcript_7812/g.19087  ORF Transcript_7812/g.19087 Transcript_7812/m.19087 type:complete len:241 (+) Transcript_7812:1016-1738(+)
MWFILLGTAGVREARAVFSANARAALDRRALALLGRARAVSTTWLPSMWQNLQCAPSKHPAAVLTNRHGRQGRPAMWPKDPMDLAPSVNIKLPRRTVNNLATNRLHRRGPAAPVNRCSGMHMRFQVHKGMSSSASDSLMMLLASPVLSSSLAPVLIFLVLQRLRQTTASSSYSDDSEMSNSAASAIIGNFIGGTEAHRRLMTGTSKSAILANSRKVFFATAPRGSVTAMADKGVCVIAWG